MTNKNDYLIELEDLVIFLNERYKEDVGLSGNIGILRLYLSIYFLYAYYGLSYGRLPVSIEGVSENNIHYPKYLVDVEFQSGSYGVTVEKAKDVLENKVIQNDKSFNKNNLMVENNGMKHDLFLYLTKLTKSINNVSEFSLVERVHEDNVWFTAFHNDRDVINNEDLIDEYYEKMGYKKMIK